MRNAHLWRDAAELPDRDDPEEDTVITSHYADVRAFHDRFHIERATEPRTLLECPNGRERLRHLIEELTEYANAVEAGDLAAQADALVDLVYVAIGNAIVQHLPWQAVWDEVQRANMAKVHDPSLPKQVRKPEGWRPPNVAALLSRVAAEAPPLRLDPPPCAPGGVPGEGWAS